MAKSLPIAGFSKFSRRVQIVRAPAKLFPTPVARAKDKGVGR